MSLPPDQPTRRLPPANPPLRVQATAAPDAEEVLWREDVRSRLRSLATALTVAIAVAFVALGVALWALVDDSGDSDGAGGERVRALQQRVARLEGIAAKAADRDSVTALQEQQRTLADRFAELRDTAGQPTADLDALQTAIQGAQQTIEQLDDRVSALEQTAPAP